MVDNCFIGTPISLLPMFLDTAFNEISYDPI